MIMNTGIRGNENGALNRLPVVQSALMEYISTQYSGAKYHSELPFIKNTLAHTIILLALASYQNQWSTFIKDMISMAGLPNSIESVSEESAKQTNTSTINPCLVDFLIKVLGSLDEEMVSPAIPRGSDELVRNGEIKDAMRVEDVKRMANIWYNILYHMSITHPELAKRTLKLIGVYVTWIDVGLIVNQPFMSVLFDMLKADALNCSACHCLTMIVSKGMRAMDKLYLLQFLGIVDIMDQLNVNDIDLAEQVGKLANITGVELKAIWVDKEIVTSEAHAAAYAMLEKLMPHLLRFLAHEYDEVSSSVFPAINEILSVFKKMQREGTALSASQQEFLSRLLPVLIDKLKYSDDYSWAPATDTSHAGGDNEGSLDEDDDEAVFIELRRNLRVFIDAIGQIAPELYNSTMLSTAQSIFRQCSQHGVCAERATDKDNGGGELGWIRAELGLYLVQSYGERLSTNKGLRFGGTKGNHAPNGRSQDINGPSVESLSELLTMMIQSGIVNCNHPAIAPLYFENVVRFGGYFEVQKEAVTPVLTSFLGGTGVRHPYNTVRPRVWYFLHRFIKQLSGLSQLSMYSSDFISAVNDLLIIRADPSTLANALALGSGYGLFDSQLYLFEACGIVLSPTSLDDSTRMSLLQHLFEPLFSGAQQLMNSRGSEQILQEPRSQLQLHHYLTAIGSIIKGFPDVRVDSKTISVGAPHRLSPNTAQVFLKAADMCIAILDALRSSQLIREASRFTLSRMLSVLGAEALPYLPRLIDGLVSNCAVEELSDLLGFLGLVVFKFKPHAATTASEMLLPVISKVYGFLDRVAQDGAGGTDEAVLLQNLRKAYLTWITALFNSDMDCIFLAPQNAQHLITIFRPISGQLAVDLSSPQCQRLSFNILHKAIQAWLVDPMGWHTLATMSHSSAVAALNNRSTTTNVKDPNRINLRQAAAQALGLDLSGDEKIANTRSQFRQFVMDTVARTCFEGPTQQGFHVADAQASLVVSEIAGLLQMALFAGMPEVANGGDSESLVASMASPQILVPPIGGDLGRNQFAVYLSSSLLPSMGCPENMATEFVQALTSLDQKQFKKYFVAFLTNNGAGVTNGSG